MQYGDSVGNSIEGISTVFSLITMQ